MAASNASQSLEMPTFPPPVNPSDLGIGPLIMGITWTTSSLALIIVCVRFWVRLAVSHKLAIEDWLMGVAVLLNLACQSCLTVAFHYGLGKHDLDLTFDQLVNIGKWCNIQVLPGISSSVVSRISISILLVRIFGVHVWLKWLLIVITVLQVLGGVIVEVTNWSQSVPVQGLWNPLIPARRLNPNIVVRMGNVAGAFFSLGDLCYVFFPVLVIWKLNMPRRQRLGLCILLALSLFTMGCSIAKAVFADSGMGGTTDRQYNASISILLSVVEQGFVIMMGCAPPLASITKLKLPFLLNISASVKKLVSSRESESRREGSNELGQSKNGVYYELGVSGQTLSDVQAGPRNDDTESHSIEPGSVRRTDFFAVKSERDGNH